MWVSLGGCSNHNWGRKRDEVPPVENDGILTAEDVSTLDLQGMGKREPEKV